MKAPSFIFHIPRKISIVFKLVWLAKSLLYVDNRVLCMDVKYDFKSTEPVNLSNEDRLDQLR